MLEFFSCVFTPYPFCKYGTVEVFPFMYGAMENQTITNLSRDVLLSVARAETTVPHEIAHH
jgi:aminopeptidase N